MGCTSDKYLTTEEAFAPLDSQNCKEENDIKIDMDMLVNENKEDVLKCYKPIEVLGEGTFGKVFKVQQVSTGKEFAMKVVSRQCNFQDGSKNILREISVLKKLDLWSCGIILYIYIYFIDYCSHNKHERY